MNVRGSTQRPNMPRMLMSSLTSEGYMNWSEHAVATKFPYLGGKTVSEDDEEQKGKERGST